MNKYRRFKYPFGGETPQEFADARRAYYENVDNSALQQITASAIPNNLKHIEPTIPEVRDYMERTGREVTDYINRNYNNQPSARKGKIIRNHDKLYDYYKDGDKLYYRKKGGKNWIDISDNETAQKRINATIARNKRSYSKPKTSSDEYTPEEMRAQGFVQNNKGYWVRPKDLEDSETYDAGTLNNVVVTGTRRKATPKPSKRKAVNPVTAINNSIFRNLYGNQERVNNVIRQGGAKSYKEYLNTPPAPTGYPKQAVIKQAPPKWRGK